MAERSWVGLGAHARTLAACSMRASSRQPCLSVTHQEHFGFTPLGPPPGWQVSVPRLRRSTPLPELALDSTGLEVSRGGILTTILDRGVS
jgi:hypothetical protein